MQKQRLWRILSLSSLLIVAPILYGISIYAALPAQMAIHFNLNNQADQWVAKPWAVFGLPLLLLVLQWFCVLIATCQQQGKVSARRFERLVYGIIPMLNLVVYGLTLQFNLGTQVDIRRIVLLVIGLILMSMGNYLPTIPADYQKGVRRPKNITPTAALRLNRALGYYFVVAGLVLLLSLLFQPWVSALALIGMLVGCFGLLGYQWIKGEETKKSH